MSDSWKVWEREGARDLGGSRTGPRGLGLPDSIDIPHLAPEFKYRQKLSLRRKDIEQARRNSKNADKEFWVVGVKQAKTSTKIAVIEWSLFVTLWNSFAERNNHSGL